MSLMKRYSGTAGGIDGQDKDCQKGGKRKQSNDQRHCSLSLADSLYSSVNEKKEEKGIINHLLSLSKSRRIWPLDGAETSHKRTTLAHTTVNLLSPLRFALLYFSYNSTAACCSSASVFQHQRATPRSVVSFLCVYHTEFVECDFGVLSPCFF